MPCRENCGPILLIPPSEKDDFISALFRNWEFGHLWRHMTSYGYMGTADSYKHHWYCGTSTAGGSSIHLPTYFTFYTSFGSSVTFYRHHLFVLQRDRSGEVLYWVYLLGCLWYMVNNGFVYMCWSDPWVWSSGHCNARWLGLQLHLYGTISTNTTL